MKGLRALFLAAALLTASPGYTEINSLSTENTQPSEKTSETKKLEEIRNELTTFLKLCFKPEGKFYWTLIDDGLAQIIYDCEWHHIKIWGYAAYPVLRYDVDATEATLQPNEEILEAHGEMIRVVIDRSRLVSYSVGYEIKRPSYITSEMGGLDMHLQLMRILPEVILCGLDFGKYNKPEQQFSCGQFLNPEKK